MGSVHTPNILIVFYTLLMYYLSAFHCRQHQPVTESTTTTVATTTTTTEPSTSSNQNFMSNQNAQGQQQQQLINAFAGFQHWHALAHQYTVG